MSVERKPANDNLIRINNQDPVSSPWVHKFVEIKKRNT